MNWISENFSKVKFYNSALWAKYLSILGVFSSVVTIIAFFITAEDIDIDTRFMICIFIFILVVVFIKMWWDANHMKSIKLKINGTKVLVETGDIWELLERNPEDREGEISVIGVNDYYDTIVDNRIIAAKSLHGQYINKISEQGKLDALEARINDDEILNRENNKTDVPTRSVGRTARYNIGSVLEFESYVLTAFTKFNENNKASLSAEEYTSFWMHFWENIDEIYAGRSINIPLMGAGITRFQNGKPSKQELLEIMLWTLKVSGFYNTYADKHIKMVLYPPDAEEIDLYGIQHNLSFR